MCSMKQSCKFASHTRTTVMGVQLRMVALVQLLLTSRSSLHAWSAMDWNDCWSWRQQLGLLYSRRSMKGGSASKRPLTAHASIPSQGKASTYAQQATNRKVCHIRYGLEPANNRKQQSLHRRPERLHTLYMPWATSSAHRFWQSSDSMLSHTVVHFVSCAGW